MAKFSSDSVTGRREAVVIQLVSDLASIFQALVEEGELRESGTLKYRDGRTETLGELLDRADAALSFGEQ